MTPKARTTKAVRRAAQTGVGPKANINLSIETIQLAHEALVQMRKPTSQVTLAVARAMNELEGLLQVFGAQQEAQAAATAEDAPAEAPAPPTPIAQAKGKV